ncbi:MAG: TetR/AcrR family transcriptional regulator, transcriptional repressor for nem operon [Chloroflexi bacterium]|jgi:AcrR family transcriptional regulator|nr:MAG: TetR/AcrR family transcriptional regulator, transcriptional repressor for nem operon [Chloroflexota bacterium]
MPAKFSEAETVARKAEILQATATIFAAKGYEATTVRDLEQATGLTRGGIFFHFPGKRPLYMAMLRQMLLQEPLVERRDVIYAEMEQAGSAELALLGAFRKILEWHAQHPSCMALFEQIHVQRDDPEIAALDAEIGASVDAFIRDMALRLQELGVFNPTLAAAPVAALMHGVFDHLTAAAMEIPQAEAEAMASSLFRVMAQGLEPRQG